jgi:hypothetical protein
MCGRVVTSTVTLHIGDVRDVMARLPDNSFDFQWVEWFTLDPEPALEFANHPDIQAALAQRGTSSTASIPREATWDRIARCESGGRWDYPLVTNRTGTYSGGLMIWVRAWEAYGGHEFAQHAYLASKAQQIVVAERILADQGWGAWDCA